MSESIALERTATLKIATPEGVQFSLPLAGPFTRSLAFFIDFMVIYAVFTLIGPLLQMMEILGGDVGVGAVILIQFILLEGSRMVFELIWRGQTIGKKILGLRVVDERGLKLRPSQIIVRNILRIADIIPVFYALGGATALFNSRSQRLGDIAAGTVVVRNTPMTPPNVSAALTGKYNSFRTYPHLEARLRQKVSPEEAQLALNALLRIEDLSTEAKVEIFAHLAERFRAKVKFPEEITFGLSDEQYVRNVTDSVFRTRTNT